MDPEFVDLKNQQLCCVRCQAIAKGCAPLQAVAAAAFGVALAEIGRGRARSSEIAFARQCAMYLTHIALGWNFSVIGLAFGRDRTTVAHACDVVERRRDDPRVNAVLVRLESAGLAVMAGRPR